MDNTFLAMLFRIKYIKRWSLMHNTQPEDLSQHTVECAFIAHMLASVGNLYYDKNYNADKLAAYAMFHDVSEVLTGDLPTPVKYFNEDIRSTYKEIEQKAADRLLMHLPGALRYIYSDYINADSLSEGERKLIKTADRLCALIKCVMELNAGNKEFQSAHDTIKAQLINTEEAEAQYFLQHCLPAFSLSLHELKGTL